MHQIARITFLLISWQNAFFEAGRFETKIVESFKLAFKCAPLNAVCVENFIKRPYKLFTIKLYETEWKMQRKIQH